MAVVCSFCGGDVVEEQEITCVMPGGNPCSACEERAIIRGQIKRLEEEILKLKAKHYALGTTMNAIHDPFIHKLPPEISSYIFRVCLPILEFRTIHSEPVRKLLLRTLKLGAVCRKWRQLAWATPNLWAILFLNIGPSTPLLKSLPGLIEEWLGRSGVLPLTIFFHQHDIYSERSETYEFALKRIIEAMNLHSDRWRNLYLDVAVDIPERFSGSMHPNQLFRLDLAINGRRSLTQKFTMKFKPFPTHLTLRNFSPTSINIGWDDVTRATVYSLTPNECVEIMRRAPALECFRASEFITRSDDPTVNIDTFTAHPRLRSLNLSDKAAKFLNIIDVPSLEEWTHCSTGVRLPVNAMVSLLKRSSCCLKVLNLQQVSANSNNLPILFQAMPSLERLQIHFRWSTQHRNDAIDDILGRIFRSPPDDIITSPADTNHEIFLPSLQFIECIAESERSTPIAWDQIPQLYRQGHRRSLTLKSVTNKFQTSDETALELLKLVDEGAKFLISDNFGGGDFLANFRKRTGREGNLS